MQTAVATAVTTITYSNFKTEILRNYCYAEYIILPNIPPLTLNLP